MIASQPAVVSQCVSVLPQIISAASGLLGALIGGGATLIATHWTTARAAKRAREELVRAKGEDAVTLLCAAGTWYQQASQDMPETSRDILYPTHHHRVRALIEAYFPSLSDKAQLVEAACLNYETTLIEGRQKCIEGPNPYNDSGFKEKYGETYGAVLATSSALRDALLDKMRSSL